MQKKSHTDLMLLFTVMFTVVSLAVVSGQWKKVILLGGGGGGGVGGGGSL